MNINANIRLFACSAAYFILLGFSGAEVVGQEKPKLPRPAPTRPPEIISLLDDARLAAPELTVDTLLRAIRSNKVADPSWKKELLEEALRTVDNVKYPVSLRPTPIKGIKLNNTEYYLLAVAYSQKLDRLSIKSQLIDLALSADPERARQMVYQLNGKLDIKPRSCDDMMTYEVGDIYAKVAKVAKASFNEKQVVDGQRALFLLPWIENIESPAQIASALDLIDDFQSNAAEKQMLSQAMARVLRQRFSDDRSLTSVLAGSRIADRIAKLTAAETEPSKADLTLAYRDLITKNLRDSRCRENEIRKEDPLPQFIEAANKLFPQNPLTYEDIAATELNGSTKAVDLLARSTSIQNIGTELRVLKGAGPDGRLIAKPDQNDLDWQARVLQMADKMLSWEGENEETESETLMVRAGMYGALLEEVTIPELRKTLVRKYLNLMAASPVQRSSFIEWYVFAKQVQDASPALFTELSREFSNINLKVMAESKILDNPTVDPKNNNTNRSN
jgi:hypothetical protein